MSTSRSVSVTSQDQTEHIRLKQKHKSHSSSRVLEDVPNAGAPAEISEEELMEPTKYLEENVFPTLLPGIEKLLRLVKRKDGQPEEELADPIGWLAQV
ncbi:hypothetical protein HK101_004427 [Irineochytrium annulatum]|nr:hypothetical protein HK101_004427 [Irineochytrium annulatum]